MGKKSKGPQTTFDKVKALDPSFVEEVYTLTTEALKERSLGITKQSLELEHARSEDQDLKSKQEQAREAGKVYREGLTAARLKQKLIVEILSERGQSSQQ